MSKEETAPEDAPKKKGKMPLIIGGIVVALAAGGGGWFFMGKSSGKGEGGENRSELSALESSRQRASTDESVFVNLEAFTFNLGDEEQDRFAQIEVVLEVVDQSVEGELQKLKPAVRNALLLILTSKTGRQLLSVKGKLRLADEMVDATNAILAGEPAPPIRIRSVEKKKVIIKKKTNAKRSDRDDRDDRGDRDERSDSDDYDRDRDRDRDARDYDDDSRYDRRSSRRRPVIPERILMIHFSKFLVQ